MTNSATFFDAINIIFVSINNFGKMSLSLSLSKKSINFLMFSLRVFFLVFVKIKQISLFSEILD